MAAEGTILWGSMGKGAVGGRVGPEGYPITTCKDKPVLTLACGVGGLPAQTYPWYGTAPLPEELRANSKGGITIGPIGGGGSSSVDSYRHI